MFVVSAALLKAGGKAARAKAASVPAAATHARLQLLGGRGKLPTVPALRLSAPAVGPHADLCRWVSLIFCVCTGIVYSRRRCSIDRVVGVLQGFLLVLV